MKAKRSMEHKGIVVFESKQVRRVWHNETWYFSVMDVVAALTGSDNPAVYWRVLKKRLKDEGSDQTVTKCNGFKMPAADGKMRWVGNSKGCVMRMQEKEKIWA